MVKLIVNKSTDGKERNLTYDEVGEKYLITEDGDTVIEYGKDTNWRVFVREYTKEAESDDKELLKALVFGFITANYPKEWRMGQSVFNAVDDLFGVARYLQFEKGLDCFYADESVEAFLDGVLSIV